MLPRPACYHCFAEHLTGEQGAAHEVEVEDALPGRQRQFAEIAARRNRRIRSIAARPIDEHLIASPLLDHMVAHAQQRLAVQRVGRLKEGLAACRFDAAHTLLATLLIASDNRHPRAGGGQRFGHRAAENAGATEDDGGFVLQIKKVVFHPLSSYEERLQVTFVEVRCHIAGNCRLTGFEHFQIAVAHLGGDFVADVNQLTHMRIEARHSPDRGAARTRIAPTTSPAPPPAEGSLPASMSITAA